MELTIEQSEMLYQIAEIHLDWILKYNPSSKTTFEQILKLNHNKLLNYFIDIDYSEKDVTKKLVKMRGKVLRLSKEY